MKTIKQLSKKYAYYNNEDYAHVTKNFNALLDENSYVKLEERSVYPKQLCNHHTIVMTAFDAITGIIEFGCMKCGYRENWGPENCPLTNENSVL